MANGFLVLAFPTRQAQWMAIERIMCLATAKQILDVGDRESQKTVIFLLVVLTLFVRCHNITCRTFHALLLGIAALVASEQVMASSTRKVETSGPFDVVSLKAE